MTRMFTYSDLPPIENDGPVLAPMETKWGLPFRASLFLEMIRLGIKHGGFVNFTAADPALIDQANNCRVKSKAAVLDMVSGNARRFLPPHTLVCREEGDLPRAEIETMLAGVGATFPLVAKPDLGSEGLGVRQIKDWEALERYWHLFPVGADIVLQQRIPYEPEAGVFYIRDPETDKAQLVSLCFKYPPVVTGDGSSTIRELIEAHPRTSQLADLYRRKPNIDFDQVPREGEHVQLSFIGNLIGGNTYRDAGEFITPELIASVDEICRSIGGFDYGRLDIKFESVARLQKGEAFQVIEINGVSSIPGHIYDSRFSVAEGLAFSKYLMREAYRIGTYHKKNGLRVPSFLAQARAYRHIHRLLKQLPSSE